VKRCLVLRQARLGQINLLIPPILASARSVSDPPKPRKNELTIYLNFCCLFFFDWVLGTVSQEIVHLIEQWLRDEGFSAAQLVLHDEANLKGKERDERANDGKRLKRAILSELGVIVPIDVARRGSSSLLM
jgi:hypothetical protein